MRYSIPLLLVAGTFALAGCGGDGKSSAPTTSTVAPATTTAPSTTTTRTTTTTKATTTAKTTTTAGPVTIRVLIEGGKPVGGIQRATVKKGQKVAIVVHSDVADEVHVHGYDLMADVASGAPATIRFTAEAPGRFEIELENTGVQIAELEVRP